MKMFNMAQRPIFVPDFSEDSFVKKLNIKFEWYPGFSIQQKQKSIDSLHESAKKYHMTNVLEISTKSKQTIGQKLSAFNLKITLKDGLKIPVEAAYQGSKIFEKGGPYRDFFKMDGRQIKKDPRLHNSGNLIGFDFEGMKWGLEPKTSFYDWIYINALYQNRDMHSEIIGYNAFSDIEFNPNKSISCQANSAALFVALWKTQIIESVLSNPRTFVSKIYSSFQNSNICDFPQNEAKVDSRELYSKLNEWRACIKKIDYLEPSNSIIKEFLIEYPQYEGKNQSIVELINQTNRGDGWFNYDLGKSQTSRVYEHFKYYIMSLDSSIKVKENKNYISFKQKNNIACVDIRERTKTVVVYLKLNPDEVKIETGFTRDVRHINHKGTGDLELTFYSKKDVDKAKDLLQMSVGYF